MSNNPGTPKFDSVCNKVEQAAIALPPSRRGSPPSEIKSGSRVESGVQTAAPDRTKNPLTSTASQKEDSTPSHVLTTLRTDLAVIAAKGDALTTRCITLETRTAIQQHQSTSLNARARAFNLHAAALKSQRQQLNRWPSHASSNPADLNAQIAGLETAVADIEARVGEFNRESMRLDKIIAELGQEKEKVERESEEFECQVRAVRTRYQDVLAGAGF